MPLTKKDFIKVDIAEYKRRIAYCDKIIKEFIRKKFMWQKRIDKKRGDLSWEK